ncbi:hypothetical protein SFA35_04360 [Pseudomonas sp. HR96]|uniref:tetratricopeptide repeat protein n=1 Tax=Pseudomonas sp. HR96 TaxID=1027966 RepID=UPI002A748543|nr:tetratricopeptide repeat protein [Pseudomonas sp. HR96]WPP00619.1 hypothetical protein SFA35_04360 [Pseudomonas sp. HR96]
MNKWLFPAAVATLALLGGCATEPRGAIPVVDSGSAVSYSERVSANRSGYRAPVAQAQPQAVPEDSGVVVMVPGAAGGSQPIQGNPAPSSQPIVPGPITPGPITPGPITPGPVTSGPAATPGSYSVPASPSGIPSSSAGGGLAADEQLDGPVLALLTTAQQQQGSGDLNGASSSLERAQRIAPREPQVLYRLAQVRLSQGDSAQAEQLAQRALTYANGRPDLQASLWTTIAQARDKQGDAAGAAAARQKAKVNL